MESKVKTIGVLTSGGDAPGMNAAIRAAVRTALLAGVKVKGIRRGYMGLLEEDIFDMKSKSVSDIIQRGVQYYIQPAVLSLYYRSTRTRPQRYAESMK